MKWFTDQKYLWKVRDKLFFKLASNFLKKVDMDTLKSL